MLSPRRGAPTRGRTARLATLAGALTLALVGAAPVAGAQPGGRASEPGVVEGSYIVTLRPGEDPRAEAGRLSAQHGGRAGHVYEHALSGFSFQGSARAAAALARNPKVRTVVADREVSIAAQTVPTGIERIDGPLSGTVSGNGAGAVDVDVAIVDTGIDTDHPDLDVVGGVNCSNGKSYEDGNGHGTHVAGTVGANDDGAGVVGVAPGARLWAVRVLDNRGSGSWSSVICGIDWVTANAGTIEVANMSLGGTGGQGSCTDGGMREAICASTGAGVTYAVAAGNSARDAANDVPASYPEVITVSALADFDGLPGGLGGPTCYSDVDDTLADFSNYGAAVDLIAPGVCILSTWAGGGYATISGTSMASPHVAGAAALYKSDHPGASPAGVKTALQGAGTLDWNPAGDPDGIKETLLNVDALVGLTIGDEVEVGNSAPDAGFTQSCDGLTCSFTDTSSDADGTVVDWDWSFGDGATSTSTSPGHTFAADGDYTVSLTVTDNDGASDSTSLVVSVSGSAPEPDPEPSGFALAASGYKVKGVQKADLSWSGATDAVDVYRNDVRVLSATANDGTETDAINNRGGGSYTYQLCEAGTTTVCSNTATVTF